MNIVRTFAVISVMLLMAVGCRPSGQNVPPTNGTVIDIVPDSASCVDQGAESVGVRYQPSGVDSTGSRWPQSVLCVTPEVASGLTINGQVWK